MKKNVGRLWLLMLFVGLAFSLQSAYAEEIYGSDCSNGVKWEYSDGLFTLYNVGVFSEQLNEKEVGMYSAAIFSTDERLIKCKIVFNHDNSSSVFLPCDAEGLSDFKVKFFFWKNNFDPMSLSEIFDVSHTEPDCVSGGYTTIYSHRSDKKEIINVSAPLGHNYGEYETIKEASVAECGYRKRTCERCGDVETAAYYTESDISRLCMYGDLTGIGKKSEVPITVSFEGEGKSFENYALLKYQGHTSLIYDKKNFTLKLFKDEERVNKNKIVFRNWKKEHKYILKANYVDSSVCRNLVSADIWSEMVACRDGHSEGLDDCSNYGATDGFPISLYLNDEFMGLYTMTLHRDDDLFDMDDDVKDAIAVTNTNHHDESRFKSPATFSEGSDWEVEFNGLSDDTWVKEKVNRLIDFVMTSTDEEFRAGLSDHMDVNSAIDYLIAIYSLGITENGSKNMTLASYSDGPWIMSLCDMECAFGLTADGTGGWLRGSSFRLQRSRRQTAWLRRGCSGGWRTWDPAGWKPEDRGYIR